MTRLSYIPQEMAKDSDDDQQWEDLPGDKWQYGSRSPSATPSGSYKSAPRTRRTTRQRPAFSATSPRKHTPSDYRSSSRSRRERGFVVEPPQELVDAPGPEYGYPIKQFLQQPTGSPVPQYSPMKPRSKEPTSNPIQQSSSTAELLQRTFGTPIARRGARVEQPPQGPIDTPGPELGRILATSLKPILCYIAEVLDTVVRMMKYPISITLAILACAYAVAIMSNAIGSALSPMCFIPVVSLLCPAKAPAQPSRPSNPERTPLWADFPNLVNVGSKTLESLLDETVEGPGLALEIKKAEMATSDLATRVRVSNLDSREILADSLSEFVKDARKVSRGLTRFSSRVGGAVDNIIAVNDYALHRIEAANSKSSGLSIKRLWSSGPSEAATKQVVTRTFTEAMTVLSGNMQRLVLEAEVSISDLNKLEEHLKSIHEVVSREGLSISSAKNELLAQLWTILGGNRDQLKGMDEHLALLRGVGGYRDRALAHVVAALQMLESMAGDMEDLRERVAAPELVGDAIPIEVHMKSLRGGLERLKGRRTGAKELEEQIVSRILGSAEGAKVTRA